MKTYAQWQAMAARWDKAVNFGSPVSAWTPLMLEAIRVCNNDTQKAIEYIKEKQKEGK